MEHDPATIHSSVWLFPQSPLCQLASRAAGSLWSVLVAGWSVRQCRAFSELLYQAFGEYSRAQPSCVFKKQNREVECPRRWGLCSDSGVPWVLRTVPGHCVTSNPEGLAVATPSFLGATFSSFSLLFLALLAKLPS